mmetsp:Transcript_413/g.631  ORF Transcript_413/g.631 Transcript_413/m.631 type:complete len:106 (+) Transcript_413:153-470(+)
MMIRSVSPTKGLLTLSRSVSTPNTNEKLQRLIMKSFSVMCTARHISLFLASDRKARTFTEMTNACEEWSMESFRAMLGTLIEKGLAIKEEDDKYRLSDMCFLTTK